MRTIVAGLALGRLKWFDLEGGTISSLQPVLDGTKPCLQNYDRKSYEKV